MADELRQVMLLHTPSDLSRRRLRHARFLAHASRAPRGLRQCTLMQRHCKPSAETKVRKAPPVLNVNRLQPFSSRPRVSVTSGFSGSKTTDLVNSFSTYSRLRKVGSHRSARVLLTITRHEVR